MPLPEREYLVDPLLPVGGLAMIYATRGLGKTWLALHLAVAVSRGETFVCFDVPKARRVLFIDGEMPLSALQERIVLLDYHREPVGHLAFDSDGNDFPARACQLSAPWPLTGNGYQFEVQVSTEACRSRLDRGIGAACVSRTRDRRITN
jgi:hypothetical protein